MQGPGPVVTWLVRVHGRVQGVGYREACVRQARRLGVTGRVRNRRDGSVEVLLQGREAPLAQMRGWLGDGPPGARVDRVDAAPLDAADARRRPCEGFERRPTE